MAGYAFPSDFPVTRKLSVRWYIFGCGEYALQPVDATGTPDPFPPVNRPVDIYLDEWVQIQPFLCLGATQRRDTSASNPAFSYDPTRYPMLNGTM